MQEEGLHSKDEAGGSLGSLWKEVDGSGQFYRRCEISHWREGPVRAENEVEKGSLCSWGGQGTETHEGGQRGNSGRDRAAKRGWQQGAGS